MYHVLVGEVVAFELRAEVVSSGALGRSKYSILSTESVMTGRRRDGLLLVKVCCTC